MATTQQGDLLWEPSEERLDRATLTRYLGWLRSEKGLEFDDYAALWRWSTEEIEAFWASVWEFCDVLGDYDEVLPRGGMPGAQWFSGAELSYAEHIFRDKPGDRVAIRHASELRELGEWTWDDLREHTARIRAGLRAMGIERGDRVVAYLPNIPETIAAFLAVASLGGVWSSCSPDFGARSVIDRFAQIEPKVLLTVDGYRYGGKDFDRAELIEKVQAEMPSLERTVTLRYLGERGDWDEAFPETDEPLEFDRVPFDHPLWVLYSSGTTGLPKAIVHSQGGILLEQLKKHHLHLDAQEDDRLFWFTTTGWMMWNFLVGVLLTDASIILYDGNPGTPDMGVLWDLAERTGMTTFGTSAAYIAGCMKAELEPGQGRDLSRLRNVGSTGSPLAPEGFEWIYEHVGADTWLFSTSGGTDLCTAFVGGVPLLPVHRGELQARALGALVEAWDEDGNAVIDEVGELVITKPMPSMPLYFWDDEDGERLRESYFEMYPGIWRHGDWIRITERGTAVITGRSDSTINRGGIRMGTAEIYRAVLTLDQITDALVVDIASGDDAWMPLFVVLREGEELDEELERAIAARVREDCSPRHLPSEVFQVKEIPRTLSGKVLEVPVKKILTGTAPEQAASRDSLANPDALDWFVELAQKRRGA